MTESLIARLAKIEPEVISRTSAMLYKGVRKPLPIARELKGGRHRRRVGARAGDQVRITAQLIRAATDGHPGGSLTDPDLSPCRRSGPGDRAGDQAKLAQRRSQPGAFQNSGSRRVRNLPGILAEQAQRVGP
jgi:hypothetical protein